MNLKQICAERICHFLNKLAYALKTSYSFAGMYEPKKPEKLIRK